MLYIEYIIINLLGSLNALNCMSKLCLYRYSTYIYRYECEVYKCIRDISKFYIFFLNNFNKMHVTYDMSTFQKCVMSATLIIHYI